MKIRYATISKEGRRSNNEDFFVVMDQQERGRFWGIVCDGMGGHACGEVASETVAHAVRHPAGPHGAVGEKRMAG